MGLFDGCLLAADIDETLLSNGKLNPRNKEKIRFFMEQGGAFSLATGRTVSAVMSVVEMVGAVSPSVLANGCMIYNFENSKSLLSLNIPEQDKRIVKLVNEKLPQVGIEIHSEEKVLLINRTQETDDHEEYEHMVPIEMPYESALEYSWNKVLFLANNDAENFEVRQLIDAESTECDFLNTTASIGGRRRRYIEQVPRGISKADGLKKLCGMLNIKKGGCFVIGDYYNDVEMIKLSDIGAAPQNAPDDVKQYADIVVTTAENGAVADFIDFLTKRKEANNGRNN